MHSYLLVVVLLFSSMVSSQDTSKSLINFSGYIDAYYSYDFSNPQNHIKNNFSYNHVKHNQFAINLAFIKANIETKNTRANIAFMTGNYAKFNLVNEPAFLQNVLEANVGVKISAKNNIWLDFGVMPSHIGFESAISMDCWNLTRSIVAENSPYYETGLKLSFSNNQNTFTAALLLLNGWQVIVRKDGYRKPNYGAQLTYKPNSKLLINYSNFSGSVYADSINILRFYHNAYIVFEPNTTLGFTIGFDFGTEKEGNWFSPVFLIRKNTTSKTKLTLRYELFNDNNQIIIPTQKNYGFVVSGVSINYDYFVKSNFLLRIEAKNYFSKHELFDDNTKKSNFSLTAAVNYKL